MAEYNLQETRYSDISEADIQHAVSSIKGNHPNAGEVMLQGHLRAQQINVQRSKICKAIHDLQQGRGQQFGDVFTPCLILIICGTLTLTTN